MKDLGAAKKILGMKITRDRKSGLLFLSQQNYVKKVLQRFNMQDAKAVSTPIAPQQNYQLHSVLVQMKKLNTCHEFLILVLLGL